jgi:hypothetical protein
MTWQATQASRWRARHAISLLAGLVALVCARHGLAASAESPVFLARQGPLIAEATFADSALDLRWRFSGASDVEIERVVATMSGQPIGDPVIAAYPQPSSRTIVLFLVDASGLGDAEAARIGADIERIVAAARPYHRFALASFAAGIRLQRAVTNDRTNLLDGLSEIVPEVSPPHLARALLSSVAYLRDQPADRKAIFLFSDGYDSDPTPPLGLIKETAARADIAIYPILRTGMPRQRPLAGRRFLDLAMMADLSGGATIMADRNTNLLPDFFLAAPFLFLDSGGIVSFSLDQARRFPFAEHDQAILQVGYAGTVLRFAIPVALPRPTLVESGRYLWYRAGTYITGIALAAIGLMLVGSFLWWRRRALG